MIIVARSADFSAFYWFLVENMTDLPTFAIKSRIFWISNVYMVIFTSAVNVEKNEKKRQ